MRKSNYLLFLVSVVVGVYFFDVVYGISRFTIRVFLINTVLAFAFLFYFSQWYCKITHKKVTSKVLIHDRLSYSPLLLLGAFPLRYVFVFPEHLASFSRLPSLLLLIVAVVLVVGWKAYHFPRKVKSSLRWQKAMWFVILVFASLFTFLSVSKHFAFHSTAYDLALNAQTIWGYSQGELLFNTVREVNLLGDHVHAIFFLIAPVYWLFSSPVTLLVLQSVFISLAAIPLFFIARKFLSERDAFFISLAYFFYPTIHYIALFDFHPEALALLFLFVALLGLLEKRYVWMFAGLALYGLCKEFYPLMFVTFGAYLFIVYKKKRMGVVSAFIGATWLYVNMFLVIPRFALDGYHYLGGQGYGGFMASTFFSVAGWQNFVLQKIPYFILLLLPLALGFFVLYEYRLLFLGVFDVLILSFFLSIGLQDIIYHHAAPLIPLFFVATVVGMSKSGKLKKVGSFVVLVASVLALAVYGPYTILYDATSFDFNSSYAETGRTVLEMIPDDASVAAPNWVLAHLSQRREAYLLSNVLKGTALTKRVDPPQYIVLDMSVALDDPKRSGRMLQQDDLVGLLSDSLYGIVFVRESWILLTYGADHSAGICKLRDLGTYAYLDADYIEARTLGCATA